LDAAALRLEDWKVANDRVKYLDDTVMRTRVQGIPIATSILAAAYATIGAKIGDISIGQSMISIFGFDFSVFQLIIAAGLGYLIPVLLLDILHYRLLLLAKDYTIKLEESFDNKLHITSELSAPHLTHLHTIGGYSVYGLIFLFGFLFILFGTPILKSIS
jgi:hypothetical protein